MKMKSETFNKYIFLLIISFSILNFSCDNVPESTDPGTTGPVAGHSEIFGGGVATPFIETNKNGPPLSVGAALKGNIFAGLDSVTNLFTNLIFTPTNNNTPFDHITVRWNIPGYIKAESLSDSHIAIDFSMISESDQNNIYVNDSALVFRMPAQNEIPADYKILKNSATDRVGILYFDTASAFLNEEQLNGDLLYGFYNGRMVLYEIVIGVDQLKSVSKIVGNIKQPEIYPRTGYFPSKYVISYNKINETFTFELIEFVKR